MKEYFIGLYEKAMPNTLTWREKLQCAKENNFDFLEASIDETDEKLKRFSLNALDTANKKFNSKKIVKQYLKLYKKVLSNDNEIGDSDV